MGQVSWRPPTSLFRSVETRDTKGVLAAAGTPYDFIRAVPDAGDGYLGVEVFGSGMTPSCRMRLIVSNCPRNSTILWFAMR